MYDLGVMIALLAMSGLFLIYLEFFLPGTIMAIAGTIFLLTSLILCYVQAGQLLLFIGYAALLAAALFITIRMALSRIKKANLPHNSDQEGYAACAFPKEMIGKTGLASSDLKPSGYIEVDGRTFGALSKLGYIDKGAHVQIIGGQGTHLIVTEKDMHHADHSTIGRNH
jgi:membrane-bound ClpP family serine protease